MNLGWIDFSDSDRKKTMDVLRLFQEQGAMDELGIGIIRDGFANYFFPGTSTIQTRAKYFFIIPYAMMDTVLDPRVTSVPGALRRLNEIEKESAVLLKKASGEFGVIGATILPKWVVRTPSTIYWNGIRTLGLFNGGLLKKMTISEYFRLALKLREEKKASAWGNCKKEAEENNKDDSDAGDFRYRSFWQLPYEQGWKEHLKIDLTPAEADYLSTKIKTSNPDSVFAYVLREGIDIEQYEDFSTFSYDLKPIIDKENAYMLTLADQFNDFISLAQIRYNLMLSEGQNEDAVYRWEEVKNNAFDYAKNVDLDAIFSRLHLNNSGLNDFLKKFRAAAMVSDWVAAEKVILKQEVRIKGSRAKLKNKSKYAANKWIGGYRLDYRFTDTRRLIKDIRKGGSNV
ncbi:MAG: hypothetical protein J6X40_02385 [Bacteroidales bacterium]|nr:hypothetical protein [Bacteroidales bacterium]